MYYHQVCPKASFGDTGAQRDAHHEATVKSMAKLEYIRIRTILY